MPDEEQARHWARFAHDDGRSVERYVTINDPIKVSKVFNYKYVNVTKFRST